MADYVTIRNCFFFLLICCCIQSVSAVPLPAGIQFNEIDHDITVRIDPIARTIEGKSIITVKRPKELNLTLGASFEVTQAIFDEGSLGQGRESVNQPHFWEIPFNLRQQLMFVFQWRGVLAPLDTSLDHQQTLNNPMAVSGEAGTFLPDASGWYPRIAGGPARYKVRLELPPGQRGLVAGRLIEENETETGYQALFEFSHPAEGIDLMAGPYVIETQVHQNINQRPIRLRTYFHQQISNLSQDYLDAVKRYLAMYESSIGEYPYTEFSIVSSPTPTGFGMPTLTYLGINVLQLPFIRDTSLGHEILHNWWGNGVYPDYRNGNWSEGLTTFMADYAYKERESSDAAREMRLDWLRDFSALQPDQDMPLAAFTSRTHGVSKIIGYNKAAMLFFMLRDQLGDAVFQRALQGLWATRRFKKTSWQHVQKMFEMVSGQSLEIFFTQWLNRIGAPAIEISEAKSVRMDSAHELTITLKQSEPVYQLRVPVVIETRSGLQTHWFDLQQERQVVALKMTEEPLSVRLDPDLRLFRQLAPDEAPPILREVMVNSATKTVLLSGETEIHKTAGVLAEKLQNRTPQIIAPDQALSTAPVLIMGLEPEIDDWLSARQLPARPTEINRKGTAQVWTMTRNDGASLAIISANDAASLEALIRPLPHYGRQSFIVFDGRQVIEKGIWAMRTQIVNLKEVLINESMD